MNLVVQLCPDLGTRGAATLVATRELVPHILSQHRLNVRWSVAVDLFRLQQGPPGKLVGNCVRLEKHTPSNSRIYPTLLTGISRYLLATCTFTPLYGRLSNVMGRRGANQAAVFFAGLGTLACGFSTNMETLIAARFVSIAPIVRLVLICAHGSCSLAVWEVEGSLRLRRTCYSNIIISSRTHGMLPLGLSRVTCIP